MLYQTEFFISLLLSLIIEIPILYLFIRFIYKNKKISVKKIIFTGIVASSLTLPYLWFVLSPYILSNYYIYIVEILVFFVEGLIYYEFLELRFDKALIVSFICNLISFIIGVIVF